MNKKVVLGFSGGLDTSFCVVWLREQGFDPICVTLDIGQGTDLNDVRQRAEALGVTPRIIDGIDTFAEVFILPALQLNALYEGVYPLATALSRPYIGKVMAEVAKEVGAQYVAHGCTGKGNDQVRIEMAVRALLPDVEVIDPIRDNNLDREYEIDFLEKRGLRLGFSSAKPYSIDQNLWGRSICAGILEDLETPIPREVFEWTSDPELAPQKPVDVEIAFEQGVPVSVDGRTMGFSGLIAHLNKLAGEHGVGRIDHIENRLVGIKSRELYEAPAAAVLIRAHRALEALTLTKSSLDFKAKVEEEYARLIYLGDWYSLHHFDLLSYLKHNQRVVSGRICLRLYKGNIVIRSRSSENSLYLKNMATYGKGSLFEQRAGREFSAMLSNSTSSAARTQLGVSGSDYAKLI